MFVLHSEFLTLLNYNVGLVGSWGTHDCGYLWVELGWFYEPAGWIRSDQRSWTYTENGSTVSACSLDLSKAFDIIN